jgi:hypothetical protein
MQKAYSDRMSRKRKDFLQLRIPRSGQRGADLVKKLEIVARTNGLSLNDVANMAVAAGLSMVERKLAEIQQEPAQAA